MLPNVSVARKIVFPKHVQAMFLEACVTPVRINMFYDSCDLMLLIKIFPSLLTLRNMTKL